MRCCKRRFNFVLFALVTAGFLYSLLHIDHHSIGVTRLEKLNVETDRYLTVSTEGYDERERFLPNIGTNICKDVNISIFYLKTHKTASSSVQNIFLRYALLGNCTIPIGSPDWARLCYPKVYNRSCPLNQNDMPYDIILQHLRYQRAEVTASLRPYAKYVTILRHPVTLIPSAYRYFNWSNSTGYRNIDDFVANYWRFSNDVSNETPYRNLMLYDMGLSPYDIGNIKSVQKVVQHLSERFDLIMFQERLQESLILLKHLLNWTTTDVVVFTLNKQSTIGVEPLKSSTKNGIISWNSEDMYLYNMLYTQFDMRVKKFGQRKMKDEIKYLQLRTEELHRKCVRSENSVQGRFGVITRYELTAKGKNDSLCNLITSEELDLIKLIKKQILTKNKKYDSMKY